MVKKEILKLLDHNIIYPISNSEWVSPVEVVPKKTGITIVKNNKGKLIPTTIQFGWRVCIDYLKLNFATRKDYFSLPFLDQMLKRLVTRASYCFHNRYSGYTKIPIALEDQEKTIFTCPFSTYAFRKISFSLQCPDHFPKMYDLNIFDLVEQCLEIAMDDFSLYGDSFEDCLANLGEVLRRC